MNKTDTHFYDSQLQNRKKEISDLLISVSKIDRENRIKSFGILFEILKLSKGASHEGLNNFSTITRDYISGSTANYDPTNQLDAADLLYICFLMVSNDLNNARDNDLKEILNIQLAEMSSGMCPQGRATRLAQVVFSFM